MLPAKTANLNRKVLDFQRSSNLSPRPARGAGHVLFFGPLAGVAGAVVVQRSFSAPDPSPLTGMSSHLEGIARCVAPTHSKEANEIVSGLSEDRLIVVGALGVGIALLFAGISRLRKKLASDANPTLYTCLNELGGYVIAALILLAFGLAMLLGGSPTSGTQSTGDSGTSSNR
jgi:uncharacterized protein YjeT (DUF2065 family)